MSSCSVSVTAIFAVTKSVTRQHIGKRYGTVSRSADVHSVTTPEHNSLSVKAKDVFLIHHLTALSITK